MRTIPRRNYVIVIIISLVSCLLVWYFANLYQSKKEYDLETNKMMNVLSEVKGDELQNYILDNHDVILYLSSSRDDRYQTFEKDLKKYLKKNDLLNEIVYFDTSKVDSNFYQEFIKNYFPKEWSNPNLNMIPNMIIMTDGKVSGVLYGTVTEPKIEDVKSFLNEVDNHA